MSGVPIRLLHEATGFQVSVELVTGDLYRGTLAHVEDNMNLLLSNVTHFDLEKNVTNSESAFIRGTNVLSVEVPEMLINSSVFRTGKADNASAARAGKIKKQFLTAKMKKPQQREGIWEI